MKWIIEKKNEILEEGKNEFKPDNFERIFLYDNSNEYGFYTDGRFFINHTIYDFKINSEKIIPYRYKTNKCNFIKRTDKLFANNIGYSVSDNERYTLSIRKDHIYFIAEKDGLTKELIIQ